MGIKRRVGTLDSLHGASCLGNKIEDLLQGGNDTVYRFNGATLIQLPDCPTPAFISSPALFANTTLLRHFRSSRRIATSLMTLNESYRLG